MLMTMRCHLHHVWSVQSDHPYQGASWRDQQLFPTIERQFQPPSAPHPLESPLSHIHGHPDDATAVIARPGMKLKTMQRHSFAFPFHFFPRPSFDPFAPHSTCASKPTLHSPSSWRSTPLLAPSDLVRLVLFLPPFSLALSRTYPKQFTPIIVS